MGKPVKVFIYTTLIGLLGIYLGAVLDLEGYLGVVLSIATIGSFIVSEIATVKKNEKNQRIDYSDL